MATPFPLLLETPPVGSQPLCVPFYLFHLALGRVRGLFSPGFEALPEFHNCRLLGVVFGSLRFTRPTSNLRECGGLLATAIPFRFETRPVCSQQLSVQFHLFHLALGRVRGLFLPGFEALPNFPSLPTLGVVFGSLRFTPPSYRLRESAGILATSFPLQFETRPL